MQHYDPEQAPDAREWLALDETERYRLVEDFHARAGTYEKNRQLHAKFHAAVETQLAEGIAPVKAAFLRLRDNGLSRHDAVRAIAAVLAEHSARRLDAPEIPSRDYLSALESLTAGTWRQPAGGAGP